MAKVNITIEDKNDGVDVTVSFDSKPDRNNLTHAQELATLVVEALKDDDNLLEQSNN